MIGVRGARGLTVLQTQRHLPGIVGFFFLLFIWIEFKGGGRIPGLFNSAAAAADVRYRTYAFGILY